MKHKDIKKGMKLKLVKNDGYKSYDVGDTFIVYTSGGSPSIRRISDGDETYCIPNRNGYSESFEPVVVSLKELIE